MPREKSRYREKRSSSYSSESSCERKKSKSKYKRRSRSRDRSESNSYKRKRSNSRSRHRKKSRSRSSSRDRYEGKSRSKSKKDRSHSRSRSRSRTKHYKSKKSRRRSRSSSSRSSSFDIEHPPLPRSLNADDIEMKIEKAIKAAAAVGLTMTKIPTYEYKEVEVKEDMPTIHDRNLLAELNSDSFVQKSFTSSRSNKKQSQNIVIDLNAQTVKVPETEAKKDDSIIDFDEIPNEEELKEMWIKNLYEYRKKMLKDEI